MTTFLKEACKEIYKKHANHLDEITIIIPNRRASVYLQKNFSALSKVPTFAPKITTINEWVDENTPERILNQTELLFFLYKIYAEVDKEEAEDFDSFLKWGKIILSDFDEIDRYIISPKEIFRDLRNIKDIDNWSFDSATLSQGQQKYADLWDKLPIYYKELNEQLALEKCTYQGRAYQNFSKKTAFTNPSTYKHYYFIGFNALSRSEECIIENLNRQKLCTVFFDVDTHYVNNKEHEAGHFYRKLRDKWKLKTTSSNLINTAPKHIEVIETAQQVAQAKIAGNIVKDFTTEQLNKTAIVLADESLLIPLSKSLPVELSKANITMGYPIKYSHLKSLFDIIFEFQHNFKKFNSDKLYHKALLKFIDHPFIQTIVNDKKRIAEFDRNIIKQNKIFISKEELIKQLPELKESANLLDVWHNNIPKGFSAITEFIQLLYKSFKDTANNELELEILYHFSKGINRFKMIWDKYPYDLSLKSFKKLFHQFWQNESLSFLGNPTEGLQIMGILETRTLDFENLIVLSMNEGNLPKSNFTNSLIPRELKIHHRLPIEQDRDAIFAHHFYRLMHRSKNIYLTYNSTSDGMGSSEKSRFITQIENEFTTDNHSILNYTYSAKDDNSLITESQYKVNDIVKAKLDKLFERGLSPSALNTFVRCPLDFYYKYILGLREGREVEENIEASTFGTMIHNVLERIFQVNFLDISEPLKIDVLQKETKNLKSYLEEEYLKEFTKSDIKYGQNRLSFDVSLELLSSFIKKQIEELKKIDFPIYIKELEKSIEANFDWTIDGHKKSIKIKGNADRIEQYGSTYRIIDYKSGKCDTTKVSIPKAKKGMDLSLASIMYHKDKGYARQLLMYALMFKHEFPKRDNFSAGIISMINLKSWVQNVKVTGQEDESLNSDILELFEDELKEIVISMYDADFIYAHDDKSKYCEYCGK
jgi:hypothetical protein